MIFRGFYHFSVAYDKGNADDPIKYFAAKENQDLGVVKALRKPVSKLDLSPFPCNYLNLSLMHTTNSALGKFVLFCPWCQLRCIYAHKWPLWEHFCALQRCDHKTGNVIKGLGRRDFEHVKNNQIKWSTLYGIKGLGRSKAISRRPSFYVINALRHQRLEQSSLVNPQMAASGCDQGL